MSNPRERSNSSGNNDGSMKNGGRGGFGRGRGTSDSSRGGYSQSTGRGTAAPKPQQQSYKPRGGGNPAPGRSEPPKQQYAPKPTQNLTENQDTTQPPTIKVPLKLPDGAPQPISTQTPTTTTPASTGGSRPLWSKIAAQPQPAAAAQPAAQPPAATQPQPSAAAQPPATPVTPAEPVAPAAQQPAPEEEQPQQTTKPAQPQTQPQQQAPTQNVKPSNGHLPPVLPVSAVQTQPPPFLPTHPANIIPQFNDKSEAHAAHPEARIELKHPELPLSATLGAPDFVPPRAMSAPPSSSEQQASHAHAGGFLPAKSNTTFVPNYQPNYMNQQPMPNRGAAPYSNHPGHMAMGFPPPHNQGMPIGAIMPPYYYYGIPPQHHPQQMQPPGGVPSGHHGGVPKPAPQPTQQAQAERPPPPSTRVRKPLLIINPDTMAPIDVNAPPATSPAVSREKKVDTTPNTTPAASPAPASKQEAPKDSGAKVASPALTLEPAKSPAQKETPAESNKPAVTSVTSPATKKPETPTVEKKETEVKPAETKPAEPKPAEAKPAEAKPETKEVKPETKEVKPETKEVKPETKEVKPEVKPETKEVKPVETKPAESKPVEQKPAETKTVEQKPAEVKTVEQKPVETKEAEKPVEAKTPEVKQPEKSEVKAETKPVESKSEAKPTEETEETKVETALEQKKEAITIDDVREERAKSDSDSQDDAPREDKSDDEETWESRADSDKDEDSKSESDTDEGPNFFYPDGGMWRPDNQSGHKSYTLDFLKQFQSLCVSKPEGLPTDLIAEAPPGMNMSRSGSFHKGSSDRNLRQSRDRLRSSNSGTNSPGMSSKSGRNALKGSSDGRKMRKSSSSGLNLRPPADLPGLATSANKWIPTKFTSVDQKEQITRKAQGILNKMSEENFESLSEKLLDVGIDSSEILQSILNIIFEKALTEIKFRSIYANLCLKLSIKCPSFGPEATFKRLLLGQCQTVFENSLTEAKEKASGANAELFASLTKDQQEEKLVEEILAKKKVIGNIRFIGELFKRQMLGDKIMVRCLQELMGGASDPTPEDLESLCVMLTDVGQQLDQGSSKEPGNSKGKVDMCFMYLTDVVRNKKPPSRIAFMIQDVLALRRNNWVGRNEAKEKSLKSSSGNVTSILQRDNKEKGRAAINTSGTSILRKSQTGSKDGGNLRNSQSGSSGRGSLTKSSKGDEKPRGHDLRSSREGRSSGGRDIGRIIADYFPRGKEGDLNKLADDVRELPSSSHAEFIKALLLHALANESDKRAYCQPTADLIRHLGPNKKMIDKASMLKGYEGATEYSAKNTKPDDNWAVADLSNLIGFAILDGCIDLVALPSVLKSTASSKILPGHDIAVNVLKFLRDKLGSTELRIRASKGLRLNSLFPGEDRSKIQAFWESEGLNDLFDHDNVEESEEESSSEQTEDSEQDAMIGQLMEEVKGLIEKGEKSRILRWADESVDPDTLQDEKFSVPVLTTLLQMINKNSPDTRGMTDQISSWENVFKLFLSTKELKIRFLDQMQHLCASLDFPAGMMEGLLEQCYEIGLIGRDSMKHWISEDSSEEKKRALESCSSSFLSDFD